MFTLKNVNYQNILAYPDTAIPAGSTTFICGESGTGKSTLLKLLNGVISPTSGEISYNHQPLESYNPMQLRREVLLISQAVYLFDKSIKENFAEFYAYRNLPPLSEAEIKKYLDICAIDLPLDSQCQVLSGGERQRIFIAINLSYQSKVVMLDEPTSALDEKNAAKLIDNIKAHCQTNNITLIVVSHDAVIAQKYADNIINLSGGVRQGGME